jgi:osmotically-inducible protein OsmY
MKAFALFTAAGAALAYFLDPNNGKRRRHMAVDRAAAFLRRFGRKAKRAGRRATTEAYDAGTKVAHAKEEPKPQPNDATLVQKVESEVFRDPTIPKGQINVNAENGVIYLRGRVDSPDLVKQLERTVRDVQGVRDVENLLHLGPEPSSSQPS